MQRTFSILALLGLFAATSPQAADEQRVAVNSHEPHVWVGPIYFSWFGINKAGGPKGQFYSPWVPADGRLSWDGSVKFHARHLKHIMRAKFNMIWAVDIDGYAREQDNLNAAVLLRKEKGKPYPKVAPYFAAGSFPCRECPKRFDGKRDRDKFFDIMTRWFDAFFEVLPEEDLVWIDDKVLIGLWWIPGAESAPPDFFLIMNNRLRARYGFEAYWSINFTFERTHPDELNWTFATTDNFKANDNGNIDLLTGFWPPGNQNPDNFAPRYGGKSYTEAWDRAIRLVSGINCDGSASPPPQRITVVSYNELTEGSGLYPAVCASHNVNDHHWSDQPNEKKCLDKPCHPHPKRDFYAVDCSDKRASFTYLDISRHAITQLEKEYRRLGRCVAPN